MIQRLSSDYSAWAQGGEMPSNAGKAFSQNITCLLSSIIIRDGIRFNGNTSHPFLDSTNESLNITDVLITRRGIEQHLHLRHSNCPSISTWQKRNPP